MKLLCALAGSALLALTATAPASAQEQPATAPPSMPVQSIPAGEARMPASPQMQAARQAMRASCAADMASLCADAAPAQSGERGGRMQCLREHAAQLSVPCRQALVAMRDARKAAKS